MIYFCADDYGLCSASSMRILRCAEEGCLNKVSVFPNFEKIDSEIFSKNKEVEYSLHLNLVEGKCMSDSLENGFLTEKDGRFKYTFAGLYFLSLFKKKKFKEQVYKEIKAQILFWKSIMPIGNGMLIDSHQHTHMIPSVFEVLMKILEEEKINVKYLRIPAEPIKPYILTPSLYFTYNPINIIKQWLLKFFWLINKKHYKKYEVPTAEFFGILFSGKMDKKRVEKVLPHFIRLASSKKKNIEVLFHPGYIEKNEKALLPSGIPFEDFYTSSGRKIEFDTIINLIDRERSVR